MRTIPRGSPSARPRDARGRAGAGRAPRRPSGSSAHLRSHLHDARGGVGEGEMWAEEVDLDAVQIRVET